MSEDTWARDQLFSFHRELGAMGERQRSLEHSGLTLRVEVKEGFDKQERALAEGMRAMRDGLTQEGAHIRGEIARLDQLYRERAEADAEEREKRSQEEKDRNERLIATLRGNAQEADEQARQARKANQRIIFAIVVLGVCAQQVLDNLPLILRVAEQFLQ